MEGEDNEGQAGAGSEWGRASKKEMGEIGGVKSTRTWIKEKGRRTYRASYLSKQQAEC
jgi:hypothetical protein